jgi:DNA-binding LytR/AlgR family response regulator
MGGFEVVRNLGEGHLPVVVIVTAFDEHAIQAFEAGVLVRSIQIPRALRRQ